MWCGGPRSDAGEVQRHAARRKPRPTRLKPSKRPRVSLWSWSGTHGNSSPSQILGRENRGIIKGKVIEIWTECGRWFIGKRPSRRSSCARGQPARILTTRAVVQLPLINRNGTRAVRQIICEIWVAAVSEKLQEGPVVPPARHTFEGMPLSAAAKPLAPSALSRRPILRVQSWAKFPLASGATSRSSARSRPLPIASSTTLGRSKRPTPYPNG